MKTLFLSIFLFINILCNAQVITFKAEAVATRLYSHVNNQYTEWGKWESCNIIIVFNLSEEKINIYTEPEQQYIPISEVRIDSTTNIMTFDCIDLFGERCTIEVERIDTYIFHIYIRWAQLQIVYQMRKI